MKILIALLLIFTTLSAFADSVTEYAYVTASARGKYYFKMVPTRNSKQGLGTLFEVNPNGEDKVIWKTEGWYSFAVYISENGEYLVRINVLPHGHELSDDHLAIAFYKKGELINSYSTKNLVKNPSAINRSIGSYKWLEKKIFAPYANRLVIVTVDNIKYVFNVSNGSIVSQKRLEP